MKKSMKRLTVAALVGLSLTLGVVGTAAADHNGPYCQAEDRTDREIFVSPGGHDYCG